MQTEGAKYLGRAIAFDKCKYTLDDVSWVFHKSPEKSKIK